MVTVNVDSSQYGDCQFFCEDIMCAFACLLFYNVTM